MMWRRDVDDQGSVDDGALVDKVLLDSRVP